MENKVLMIATVPSMIGQFNLNNIDILKKMGYEVDIAGDFLDTSVWPTDKIEQFKKQMELENNNCYQIDFSRNPLSLARHLKSYKEVKDLLSNRQYSFIHTHTPIASAIVRLVAHRLKIKVVYTAHGFHFFDGAPKKNWIIFYPIEKMLSRYTEVLITINVEDYKRAKDKFYAKKIEYLPGIGVDTKAFQNATTDRKTKRQELGFEETDFIFMSVGQVFARKNFEVAIRALAKIDDKHAKYLIVGLGELIEPLKQLAKELGVAERVTFAGYRSDVKELLHAVDGFIFPSLQEGLPVSLMEAMSVGLPVVCSRIRGNVDLVKDGQGGYLYDCNDVDGFAEGMSKIIHEDNQRMGMINIETMKKFDIENVNEEMRRIYSNI